MIVCASEKLVFHRGSEERLLFGVESECEAVKGASVPGTMSGDEPRRSEIDMFREGQGRAAHQSRGPRDAVEAGLEELGGGVQDSAVGDDSVRHEKLVGPSREGSHAR